MKYYDQNKTAGRNEIAERICTLIDDGPKYRRQSDIIEILKDYTILDEYTKPTANALWRLTIPVYFFVSVLMFIIVMPVKWLLTGNYYWKYESFVRRFMGGWVSKLF